MSTSNAQRFLADGGDDRALALKMFWGLVLTSFRNKTLLWNSIGEDGVGTETAGSVVSSKTVTSGKSWQFVFFGEDTDPEYHTQGTELLGQQFEFGEATITIDTPLVKHFDLPLEHIRMAHWDTIAPVARSVGRSLAINFDKRLFIVGVQAANSAAVTKDGLTIHNGGNVVTRSGTTGLANAYPVTSAGATNFIDDVAELAETMDNDSVPEDGRFLYINPYIRRVLSKAPDSLFSKDFDASDANMKNRRVIGMIEGFMVAEPTQHLPSTLNPVSAPPSDSTKYQGDFTYNGSDDGQPAALALCGAEEGQAGVGYVTSGNPSPIMEPDNRRGTMFMKGEMYVGAGQLAPYCAGAVMVTN